MERLAELFNVNHFIVSQVNPFTSLAMTTNKVREWPRAGKFDDTLESLKGGNDWIKLELMRQFGHGFMALRRFAGFLGLSMPTQAGIVGQTFHGDITITPRFRWRDILLILTNPDADTIRERMGEAMTATWPSIERVRLNTEIEYRLEDALRDTLRGANVDPSKTFALGLDSKRLLFGGSDGIPLHTEDHLDAESARQKAVPHSARSKL